MNLKQIETIILSGTIEIYEQMVDRKNMVFGYYLKIDKNTDMGEIFNKCFCVGYNRCIGLRIDSESILGFMWEFIIGKLMEIDYDEWNNMSWNQREKLLVLNCNNRFRELSKDEGTNFGISYGWNSETKKREYEIHNNTSYEVMMEQGLESEIDEAIKEKRSGDLTSYIFKTYMNENYLTKKQLKFIKDCLDNYIDVHGNIVDIVTEEILYRKDTACKLRANIKKRLEKLIDEDIFLDNSNGRFIYKR